jgi:hypothetical protein
MINSSFYESSNLIICIKKLLSFFIIVANIGLMMKGPQKGLTFDLRYFP